VSTPRHQLLLYRIRIHKDAKAFTTLFIEYKPGVMRFLVTKLPTKQDAEDALTTTFVRVWNYLTTSKVDKLGGLIFTIARTVVADYYRSRKLEMVSIESAGEDALEITSRQGSFQIMAETDVELMKRSLLLLDETQQQAIILRFFDGLSIREVAERLEKSEGATSVYIHRALKILREKISHDGQRTDQLA